MAFSAAAVPSEATLDAMKTPCAQERASLTSGTTVARRPPNRIALIGTPFGSSHSGAITGHWRAGAVKRAFGCAAGLPFFGVHGSPSQSVSCGGGSFVISSHQTSPSGVSATLVKIAFSRNDSIALGFDFMLV